MAGCWRTGCRPRWRSGARFRSHRAPDPPQHAAQNDGGATEPTAHNLRSLRAKQCAGGWRSRCPYCGHLVQRIMTSALLSTPADLRPQLAVHRLAMAHPGDLSALAALFDAGTVAAEEVVAVIGKTEGN
ncbi:MAG: ring-opening amidohydrolase, partial [Gammaproteobacteria bacterium]